MSHKVWEEGVVSLLLFSWAGVTMCGILGRGEGRHPRWKPMKRRGSWNVLNSEYKVYARSLV